MRLVVSFCLLFLFGCIAKQSDPGIVVLASKADSGSSDSKRTTRYRSLSPSRRSRSSSKTYTLSVTNSAGGQAECRATTNNPCSGDSTCRAICEDLFRTTADRSRCLTYPKSIIEDFKELLNFIDVGNIGAIKKDVLECLLDIDTREFAREIRDNMDRVGARRFLIAIAKDSSLAQILENEDDDFTILKRLLHKITGNNNLISHLTTEIEGAKTFLWLSAINNEPAWDYLNDYVADECGSSPPAICSDGENIEAFCSALVSNSNNQADYLANAELTAFLTEADLFAEDYEDDVESDDYLYKVTDNDGPSSNGDFRDWCGSKID